MTDPLYKRVQPDLLKRLKARGDHGERQPDLAALMHKESPRFTPQVVGKALSDLEDQGLISFRESRRSSEKRYRCWFFGGDTAAKIIDQERREYEAIQNRYDLQRKDAHAAAKILARFGIQAEVIEPAWWEREQRRFMVPEMRLRHESITRLLQLLETRLK